MFDLWFVLCLLILCYGVGLLVTMSCVVVCFFYYIGLIGRLVCGCVFGSCCVCVGFGVSVVLMSFVDCVFGCSGRWKSIWLKCVKGDVSIWKEFCSFAAVWVKNFFVKLCCFFLFVYVKVLLLKDNITICNQIYNLFYLFVVICVCWLKKDA